MTRALTKFTSLMFLIPKRLHFISFSLAIVCFAFPIQVEAIKYQLPATPTSPTSYEECQALFDRYNFIARKLGGQAKRIGDKAWEVAKRQGHKAAKPFYKEASRLRDEAFQVSKAGSRARLLCRRRVGKYKYKIAEEMRNRESAQREHNRSLQEKRRKNNRSKQKEIQQKLKTAKTTGMPIGKKIFSQPIRMGKEKAQDKLVKTLFPSMYGDYKTYKAAQKQYGKYSGRIVQAKMIYDYLTGKKNLSHNNYSNIQEIISPLADSGLNSYPLSKAIFQIMLPGIIAIQADALSQFDQQMKLFNDFTLQSQIKIPSQAQIINNSQMELSNLREDQKNIKERWWKDKRRQENLAKQQAAEERRKRLAREQASQRRKNSQPSTSPNIRLDENACKGMRDMLKQLPHMRGTPEYERLAGQYNKYCL